MLRKSLEAKRRHHYVWAKYLTRWGNGTDKVFYTTKNGKFAHDSVRAIAVDNYFYKVTTLSDRQIARAVGQIPPGMVTSNSPI